jgi:hypothetical protein
MQCETSIIERLGLNEKKYRRFGVGKLTSGCGAIGNSTR